MIGTAPWAMIMWPPSAAASPRSAGMSARSAISPLGRPNAAETTALPWAAYALAHIVLSMRCNAIGRPPGSQIAALRLIEQVLPMVAARCLSVRRRRSCGGAALGCRVVGPNIGHIRNCEHEPIFVGHHYLPVR
jgi:hypothetical protein